MSNHDAIAKLKSDLASLQAKGDSVVSIEGLLAYVGELEEREKASFEHLKLKQQIDLASYDAKVKHSVEMFKSVIESAREALNALVLINGGAVVALLGFLGASISKGLPATVGLSLTSPLAYFGCGVLFGALAFGARYVSQAGYAHEKKYLALGLHAVSVVCAVGGYVVFGLGIAGAYYAFHSYFAA